MQSALSHGGVDSLDALVSERRLRWGLVEHRLRNWRSMSVGISPLAPTLSSSPKMSSCSLFTQHVDASNRCYAEIGREPGGAGFGGFVAGAGTGVRQRPGGRRC